MRKDLPGFAGGHSTRLISRVLAVSFCVSCLCQFVYADDLLAQARANVSACSSCHSGGMGSGKTRSDVMEGSGAKTMVPLNTLSAASIEQSLLQFRSGEREGTVMNRLARGYSKSEIAAMAQVLGSQ